MKSLLAVPCWFLAGLALAACQRAEPAVGAGHGAPGAASGVPSGDGPQGAGPTKVVDQPVEPFVRELLELAFDAASRYPMNPHAKSRGRAQEQVVGAAFELDQPLLALRFAPQISDWRRGVAYADFAWYSARHGVTAEMQRYVDLAQGVVDDERKLSEAQEWRADAILIEIARAWRAAGDTKRAEQVARALVEPTGGAVDERTSDALTVRVAEVTPMTVDGELGQIDASFKTQDLGDQFTSMVLVAKLHGKFYADERLRKATETRLCETFVRLPPDVRIRAMSMLVENAIAHGDAPNAVRLIGELVKVVDGAPWRPSEHIPQLAHIAELRTKAGDTVRARAELEAALRRYHEQREQMENWERAEAVRPLAIVWHLLGDAEQAEGTMSLAIEEGAENPNARPRCDDLVDTCVAMARNHMRPSERLWQRLRELRDGLVAPW